MDQAQLHLGQRKHHAMASGKPLSPSTQPMNMSLTPRFQLRQNMQPKLGPLRIGRPHPQHLFVPGQGDAQRQIHRHLGTWRAAPCPIARQIDNRIHLLQGTALGLDIGHHRVGHLRNQGRRHLHAVGLQQMPLNLPRRHAPNTGSDRLVKALKAQGWPLATICGSKTRRSRGAAKSRLPTSPLIVLGLVPCASARVLPAPACFSNPKWTVSCAPIAFSNNRFCNRSSKRFLPNKSSGFWYSLSNSINTSSVIAILYYPLIFRWPLTQFILQPPSFQFSTRSTRQQRRSLSPSRHPNRVSFSRHGKASQNGWECFLTAAFGFFRVILSILFILSKVSASVTLSPPPVYVITPSEKKKNSSRRTPEMG